MELVATEGVVGRRGGEVACRDWENAQIRPTGLCKVTGFFQTPFNSYIHGVILKPFGMVRAISGWFCLVYDNG